MAEKQDFTIKLIETGSKSEVQTVASAADNAAPPSRGALATRRQVKATAVASMIGRKAFSYTTSNIGKWTGSSYTQQQVNNAFQVGGLLSLYYINPVLGAVSTAGEIATTAIDYVYEQKWDRKRSKQDLARLGYSSQGELLGRKR